MTYSGLPRACDLMTEAIILGVIGAAGGFAASYLTFVVNMRELRARDQEIETKRRSEMEAAAANERNLIRSELWAEMKRRDEAHEREVQRRDTVYQRELESFRAEIDTDRGLIRDLRDRLNSCEAKHLQCEREITGMRAELAAVRAATGLGPDRRSGAERRGRSES